MHRLYDRLIADGGSFIPQKDTDPVGANAGEEHHSGSSPSHLFIRSIAIILSNIGLHGVFNSECDALLMDGLEAFTVGNRLSYQKMTNKRRMQCLQLLIDCGLRVSGLDLGGKAPAPTNEPLIVTYPKNPHMLAGLKVMAVAQDRLGTKYLGEILHRCDYRALANRHPETLPVLEDLLRHLPAGVQGFMLDLHKMYIKHGFKCITYIGGDTRFEYFCASRELWRFNMTFGSGYNITIKANNTDKYPELVKMLPQSLQERIARGYGCGKKMGITNYCDSGCRGYCIPLDDTVVALGDIVRQWIQAEMGCILKREVLLS
jgi:hypothetical protein